MASQSLYRKWRPQTFAYMVGQEHVARTLLNAVREGRAVHAYLFTGPRGTGKTSAARILAKALNCRTPLDGEPCNACDTCRAITEGRSLDVIEIDGASNRGIDQMRELRERVGVAPAEGRYRLYIIDEVHQLTGEAFNALLKTLEEPPAHVVFVLATTDEQKLLKTVVSRCQRHSFHKIAEPLILDRLRVIAEAEGVTAQPGALRLLAKAAEGGLRDGLSLLDQAIAFAGKNFDEETISLMLGLVPTQAVASFIEALEARDAQAGLALIHQLVDQGSDPLQFNRQLVEALRDGLSTVLERRVGAAFGSWTPTDLSRALRLFSEIQFGGRSLAIPQLPLELALVDWCAPVAAAQAVAPAPPQSRRVPQLATSSASDSPPPENAFPLRPAAVVPPPPSSASDQNSSLVATSVPDDVRRNWLRVMDQLRQKSRMLHAYCNSCQLQGVRDDVLIITTQAVVPLEKLSSPTARAQVEEIIKAVFGKPYGLRCERTAETTAPGELPLKGPSHTGSQTPNKQNEAAAGSETAAPRPNVALESESPDDNPQASGAPSAITEEQDLIELARQDPVVQEVIRQFPGSRVEGVIRNTR